MKTHNMKKLFNKYKKVISTFLIVLLMYSCSAPKDVVYFQDIKNLDEITTSPKINATFKSQDIVSIVVSSADQESAIPFNTTSASIKKTENTSVSNNIDTKKSVYLIDSDGMIDFPVLGKLKIAGLSTSQVREMIKEKLKTYIKQPTISVRLENFKITVLGEVRNPGPFVIDNERVTLIEAIGLAGDLSINGKRTNITVIREDDNKQIIHKIDITTKDIFNSPAYYLKQNDIVYVEPNSSRTKMSRTNNWPRVLTSVGSLLGIIISIIVLTR